jgi:hypothetical protein
MKLTTDTPYTKTSLPDHTQLPESDGTFVKNWQEHPQSILLMDSINGFNHTSITRTSS